MSKYKLLFVLVLTLFLFTRLYKINEIPPSVYWDEASIGYNAFSILETGRDEWGKFLPLHFRAFGEFKLPVYIYSSVPAIGLFGLNELAVRFPAVVFSLSVVLLTFLIARKILGNTVAFISTFLLTISPWFLIFSRVGYEATAGLAFYLGGIYLFLLKDKNKYFLALSMISLLISMYSHTSFRIISPPTFILLTLFFVKLNIANIRNLWIVFFVCIFIFFLGIIPIIRLIIYDSGFGRLQAISVLPLIRWVTPPSGKAEFQIISAPNNDRPGFIRNYLSHFNPDFLISNGDKNPRNHIPGSGQIFYLDALIFIIGMITIFKFRKREYLFPLIILLLAPVPASLTTESPHALRSLSMVPFIVIISAVGIKTITDRYLSKKRYLSLLILAAIYTLFFYLYFKGFISNYNEFSSQDWQFSYKQIFQKYSDSFKDYDKVIISDQYAQPYIFHLFYNKYDPVKFKSEVKYNSPDRWGFSTVNNIGNIEFRKIELSELTKGNLLIFASINDKLNIEPKEIISNLDGSDSIYVYEINR